MPFFNFRRNQNAPATSQGAAPESAETLRRRAKHRLIGSVVLVLAGVIGFPLVFDTQPRPVAVDIPIEIPGKTAVKPLVRPPVAPANVVAVPPPIASPSALPITATTPATPPSRAPSERVAAAASLAPEEEIVPSKAATAQAKPLSAATKPEAKAEAKPTPQPLPKVDAKAVADAKPSSADEAARARALLNGTAPVAVSAPAATSGSDSTERFIVQIGAFAEVIKAREARLKVEGAGLKTYTQVAETTGGKRIRVRVGPFATRTEADKAASKIKILGLPAAILTLQVSQE